MTDPTNVTGISPKFDPKLANEIDQELQSTKKRHPAKGVEPIEQTLERVPTGPRKLPGEPEGGGLPSSLTEVYKDSGYPVNPKRSEAAKKTQARLKEEREKQKTLEQMQQERYEAQERKRAVRFQMDQNGTLYLLIALAGIMFISSAIITAAGTIEVATESMQLPFAWMSVLVFGAIEVSILVFLVLYTLKGSRGESAFQWFGMMLFASFVTVAAQIYHVVRGHDFNWLSPDLWAGVILAAVVAVGFVTVSKGVASAVFAKTLKAEQ